MKNTILIVLLVTSTSVLKAQLGAGAGLQVVGNSFGLHSKLTYEVKKFRPVLSLAYFFSGSVVMVGGDLEYSIKLMEEKLEVYPTLGGRFLAGGGNTAFAFAGGGGAQYQFTEKVGAYLELRYLVSAQSFGYTAFHPSFGLHFKF